MHDWARAFPRLRHTRVMKPRSAGNSPSSAGRRRTTVAQSVTHGMPSHYHQSSLEAALFASAVRNARPISWHPSSARSRGLSNPTRWPDYASENFAMGVMPDQSSNGMPDYGSDSMMSYPVSADPTFSPGYFPAYSDMQESLPLQQQTPSLPMASSQFEPMAWDTSTTTTDFLGMHQTVSDAWSLDVPSMATNIPPAETTCPSYASVPSPGELSGPSTPDFLPIQQFDDEPASTQKKDCKPEEELVGMGLYSQPNNAIGQVQLGTLGKGLKLEETFSPSDDESDDADADAEDDEVVDVDVEAPEPSQPQFSPHGQLPMAQQSTFQIPKQPSKQALNLLHKSFFFDHDDFDQQAMPVAQPFANLNQACMSYGYGWI
ncbi:uncharacterized protein N7482_007112 [Penicillium canariense]|uniref:Uncharacterized protein n=1 Tax=Penicillium canariense TaxID=189055 RepID=A0A9W9HYF1_9EURO|nr:uncharacterized protein N7482_007112 [Penicillium canariense]KAJ5160108.1 hypothetical protein N7482_007112 [Penicillium canariense]